MAVYVGRCTYVCMYMVYIICYAEREHDALHCRYAHTVPPTIWPWLTARRYRARWYGIAFMGWSSFVEFYGEALKRSPWFSRLCLCQRPMQIHAIFSAIILNFLLVQRQFFLNFRFITWGMLIEIAWISNGETVELVLRNALTVPGNGRNHRLRIASSLLNGKGKVTRLPKNHTQSQRNVAHQIVRPHWMERNESRNIPRRGRRDRECEWNELKNLENSKTVRNDWIAMSFLPGAHEW